MNPKTLRMWKTDKSIHCQNKGYEVRPGIPVDTQNTGQTSVCGHTNKPLRGEARGGLTTEQAAKNGKWASRVVSGRLTPGRHRMARFRSKAPRGRERPWSLVLGARWGKHLWASVSIPANKALSFAQCIGKQARAPAFGADFRLSKIVCNICRRTQGIKT